MLLVPISFQLVSLSIYSRDRNFLEKIADRISRRSSPPSKQVIEVLGFFREIPAVENNDYFLLPVFKFLRPTACQVLEKGGDCADRSRLLITILKMHDVRSRKWALYDNNGVPRHAVVEVDVENGNMVADPLFGIWFPRREGGYNGIQDLQKNSSILKERILLLRSSSENPGAVKIDRYPLEKFNYENVHTINWKKSLIMRSAYWLLHSIAGEKAKNISRPECAEEPALMVVYIMVVPEVIIITTLFLYTRKKKTNCFVEKN